MINHLHLLQLLCAKRAGLHQERIQEVAQVGCRQKLMSCAFLLPAQKRESGVWLNALPLSAIGLWMDGIVQVAIGLYLGVPLCLPHDYQHCRTKVNSLGTHGLSCHRSQGRHSCHEGINALIQRHLSSAGIPAQIEPMGV